MFRYYRCTIITFIAKGVGPTRRRLRGLYGCHRTTDGVPTVRLRPLNESATTQPSGGHQTYVNQ